VRTRDLVWEGCLNVRDLGGHPTEHGGETSYGAYVRAASIDRLTESGWQALVDYGVRTIVDLRLEEERDVQVPPGLPVVALHRPMAPAFGHPDWWEHSLDGEPAEATRGAYLAFLERFGAHFAEAVTAIASADEGAVLFHCMGGKDRTGLVAALMLRLAGVGPGAIAADYALSADNLGDWLDSWIEAAEDDEERARRTRICASPAEAMLAVLAAVDERFGGAEGYLCAAGVDEELLDRVRARLLG
jgi:protein-tyrosine phosphatase